MDMRAIPTSEETKNTLARELHRTIQNVVARLPGHPDMQERDIALAVVELTMRQGTAHRYRKAITHVRQALWDSDPQEEAENWEMAAEALTELADEAWREHHRD